MCCSTVPLRRGLGSGHRFGAPFSLPNGSTAAALPRSHVRDRNFRKQSSLSILFGGVNAPVQLEGDAAMTNGIGHEHDKQKQDGKRASGPKIEPAQTKQGQKPCLIPGVVQRPLVK